MNVESLSEAHWDALPSTLPTVALAYIYQSITPVISSRLEVSHRLDIGFRVCLNVMPCP